MFSFRLVPTLLIAVAACFCAGTARADNYRWSTDGGETWTDAATLSGAASAVGSNDAIIEVCADNDQMFASAADITFSGNVTIRSKDDAPYTITRNLTGNMVGGATGKEIVLTNVIFKSNGGTARFFTLSPGTLRLKAGAKFTSDPSGTGNTKCALCSKETGEVHFEGGVIDGWLSSDESPVYLSGGSKVYITAGGIENCVNTSGNSGQDSSAVGSNHSGDRLTMSGGFIRNNAHQITSGNSSAVVFNNGGTITLTGGQITGNTFGGSAGYAIRLNSSSCVLALSGTPVVSGNLYDTAPRNVYLGGACVRQVGDLLDGANVCVSGAGSSSYVSGGGTFGTTTAGLAGTELIYNDKIGSAAEASGTNLIWPNGARYSTDNGATWTEVSDAKAAFDAVKAGSAAAIIESRADCELFSSSVTPSCSLTLRSWSGSSHVATLSQGGQWVNWNISDGLTLTLTNIVFRGGSLQNNGLFLVKSGGTLRLESGSRVTTASSTATYAIKVEGGDLYFAGGIVSGWSLSANAPVYLTSASAHVYLSAGGIENCTNASYSTSSATAIGASTTAAPTDPMVVMTGGFIRNNHNSATGDTTKYYGALAIREKGVVSISGGAITNNTGASAYFAGVSIPRGEVRISGNPVIADNRAVDAEQNVVLTDGDTYEPNWPKLYQSGNLTAGAAVGVCSPHDAEDETFGALSDSGYTGAECFLNDRDEMLVGSASGTDLVWTEKAVAKVSLTVPAKTGLNAPTVTASVGEPEEISSGVWSVVANSTVTLAYTAATGYRIVSGNPVEVAMGTADRTLAADELPTVQQQVLFTIPARTGLVFASIAGGHPTTATEGAAYYVDPNSELTVTFAAADGYQLTSAGSVVYQIGTTAAELDTFPTVQKIPVAPSIGSVTAETSAYTATISLDGVVKGTDAQAVDATSYSVWYRLGDGADVEKLSAQTAASVAFELEDLDEGDYTGKVWIVTNVGRSSETNAVEFTIAGVQYGWTVAPVDDESTFVTDGTLVNACSIQGGTINGISFSQTRPITTGLAPVPVPDGSRYGDYGWGGWSEGGSFQQMLSHASFWTNLSAAATLTFSGLTSGRNYLVQFVSHNDSAKDVTISIEGTTPQHVCATDTDDTYRRGASIVGVFRATAATKTVSVSYTGTEGSKTANHGVLNAIQIRDLGAAHIKTVTLSVPAKTGLETPEVSCTEGTPTVVSEGVWKVPQNSAVTLTYTAKTGYAITGGNPVEVAIGTVDVTLTADQLPTVQKVVADPTVGSVTASTFGKTATISLADVQKGTDDLGADATSYAVWYRIDSGSDVEKLTAQTAASVDFDIGNLAEGAHACAVWVVNSGNRSSATNEVNFTIRGAFDDLKDAIEGASAGATVKVAKGTYRATAAITVNKRLTIVSDDGPGETVLDGQGGAYHLFAVSAEHVTISGITFRNAGDSAIAQSGSAYDFVVTNCVFRDCQAEYGAGVDGNLYYGEHDAQSATVFPARGAMGVISDCVFSNCVATGTAADSGAGAVTGPFWIERSSFDACAGTFCAAAVLTAQNTMVTNCVFRNCPASKRPAVYMNRSAALRVLDCRFENMACGTLLGCIGGGTIFADRCDIANCAGAETLESDATVYAIFSSAGVLRNSLIRGNRNPFNLIGESYQNCTIADNVGGLFIKFRNGGAGPASSFTNCTFAGNVKWPVYGKGGAGLQWHGASADANVYKNLVFAHCALEGASDSESGLNVLLALDATGATGTISAEADEKGMRFTDAAHGDWTPRASSPLKNAGVRCDWMTGALDLKGRPRILQTAPDVGCCEHRPSGVALFVR